MNFQDALSGILLILLNLFNPLNLHEYRSRKRFAAMVGMVFAGAILICSFTVVPYAPMILAAVLAFFAVLESFFSFCAGCYVYSYGKKLRLFK